MTHFRVASVFGTRPEAIKMAPVVKALEAEPDIESIVIVTAQHREMLDQVLELFGIAPHVDLNLMQTNQTLPELTTAAVSELSRTLGEQRPDLLLVHGDTTTTFTAALAAFYQRIPVGHVEAGLRTRDRYSPWPEEINRRLTGTLASLHFAPTSVAASNLTSEAVDPDSIVVTGNTVVDALMSQVDRAVRAFPPGQIIPGLDEARPMVLVTGHRRENFEAGLDQLCLALLSIRDETRAEIVFPVHMNPTVKGIVYERLQDERSIHLTPPLGYLEFISLMKHATLIISDSGGIQEEAPSLGTPVLVTRTTTERPEGIEAGTSILTGNQFGAITEAALRILRHGAASANGELPANPYGDGKAARRIVNRIRQEMPSCKDT